MKNRDIIFFITFACIVCGSKVFADNYKVPEPEYNQVDAESEKQKLIRNVSDYNKLTTDQKEALLSASFNVYDLAFVTDCITDFGKISNFSSVLIKDAFSLCNDLSKKMNVVYRALIENAHNQPQTTKQIEPVKNILSEIQVINATDFYAEYKKNKFAFNQKYNDKIVTITGNIESITDKGDITLNTNTFIDIRCYVQNKDKVINLAKDQQVTITGKYKEETSPVYLDLFECTIK